MPPLPSRDFFLGVAVTLTVVAMHKLYHLLDEPSIEAMEARATAPLAAAAENEKSKSTSDDDKTTTESTDITIFGFEAAGEHAAFHRGVLDASPYVMYVEISCRMMGQSYTKVRAIPAERRFRPRHKLPVAKIRGVGMLDDSRKIVEAIMNQNKQEQGDSKSTDKSFLDYDSLDDDQRALARLVENTLTQSLFWSMAHNKWATQRGREAFRRELTLPGPDGNMIPVPLRPFIAAMAFRHMDAQLMGHGIARYPRTQVLEKAKQDLAALSQILGSKDYILGGTVPSLTDALMYAMLVLVFEDHELQADLNSTKEAYPNLAAHVERMKKRYVPEC